METAKSIKIACKTMLSLDIAEIDVFQGELKTLSKTNFEKLRKEILDTGYAFAMHVWQEPKTNRWKLVDGTQRFRTLTHLITKEGYECDLLPVVPVAADDYKQAKRRVLQGTSQYGEMTGEGLYEFMTDAELQFDELDAFRLPDIDLDDFREEFEEQTGGHSPEDDVPEVKPDDKRVKLGDLFILGEHRLLCGDSTDKATVDRLMNGEKADMVFTDPPYNLGGNMDSGIYSGTSLKSHVDLAATKWDDNFDIKPAIKNLISVLSDNSSMYICTSHFLAGDIWEETKNKMDRIGWCIWDKPNPTPSMQKRHWTWCAELICYSTKGKHTFNFPNEGHAPNVWRFNKESHTEGHPTQKPVLIPEHAILHSSNKDHKILDLFGGSGSTLIACEKTKRKCFMSEIDPTYCSVILDRWAKFTSLDPIREDGKKWSEIK